MNKIKSFKKINCPECGMELINLYLDSMEDGISEFWCSNCNIDITINVNY